MAVFNDTPEVRARVGAGSGIYFQDANLQGKYRLLIPTVSVPFIQVNQNEIEIKVVTSATATKLATNETLESSEAQVYMHRDCIRKLEKIGGQKLNLLLLAPDFGGYRFTATISYTPEQAEQDQAWMGKIKIVPITKPVYIENNYDVLIPTAHFKGTIPDVVYLENNTPVKVPVEFKEEGTTINVKAVDDTVATAVGSGADITLTAKKAGSTIVNVETSKTGFAPWETSILVIVLSADPVVA